MESNTETRGLCLNGSGIVVLCCFTQMQPSMLILQKETSHFLNRKMQIKLRGTYTYLLLMWEKSKHKIELEFIVNVILFFIIYVQKQKRRNLVLNTWKWYAPSLLARCSNQATTIALESQKTILCS